MAMSWDKGIWKTGVFVSMPESTPVRQRIVRVHERSSRVKSRTSRSDHVSYLGSSLMSSQHANGTAIEAVKARIELQS